MAKEPEPTALMRVLTDKMSECAALRAEIKELKALLHSDYAAISRMQSEYLERFIDDTDNGRPTKFSYGMLRQNFFAEKRARNAE